MVSCIKALVPWVGVYFIFTTFVTICGMAFIKGIKSKWNQNSKGIFSEICQKHLDVEPGLLGRPPFLGC